MTRLQHGHRRWSAFAGAALVAAAVLLVAPAARAETLGGEGLAGSRVAVDPGPDASALPRVKAATWVLADAGTGAVLAHKGAHVHRAPASTLKMLTALAVLPRVPTDATYVATPKAAYTYGSRVGLRPGKTYTLDDLWYAVFLPSANDAAIAVAEANGGVRTTVAQMNAVALELRALDTVARTPNGLDAPGQRSSAYDLALIAREGLTRPDFATYASAARATFPDVKGKGRHPIYTTNRLLLHGWKGVIGVKTGFTSQAGRTYVGAATRGGRTLIVTLMGIRESSEDAARKLLAWGFDNAEAVTPVGQLVAKGSPLPDPDPQPSASPTPVPLSGGDGTTPSAASPATPPSPMPAPVVVAAIALVIGGAGVALLARRRRVIGRPPGRHAA